MTRPGSTSLTSRRPHTSWLAGGFAGTALLLASCSGAGAAMDKIHAIPMRC